MQAMLKASFSSAGTLARSEDLIVEDPGPAAAADAQAASWADPARDLSSRAQLECGQTRWLRRVQFLGWPTLRRHQDGPMACPKLTCTRTPKYAVMALMIGHQIGRNVRSAILRVISDMIQASFARYAALPLLSTW